jgi:hypothetical protein
LNPFAPLPDRKTILQAIYSLNGGNFTQIEYYLGLTVEEFLELCDIHNRAVKQAEERYKRGS